MKITSRKTLAFVLSVILLLAICTLVAGCSNDNTMKDLEQRITELENKKSNLASRVDELEKQNEKMRDENDNLVGRIDKLAEQVYGGKLYLLSNAYDKGWLTQEDLLSIAYYHNGRTYNTELMDENYQPIAKSPEFLSEDQELAIKQSIINSLDKKLADTVKLEQIRICDYYGMYNGGIALRVTYTQEDSENLVALPTIRKDSIGGVTFFYPHITVWPETYALVLPDEIMFWRGNI